MQGEADSHHPGGQFDGYNCTLPAMIRDWRRQWHAGTRGATDPNIPFGIAQLNSVGNGTVYNNPIDETGGDPYSPTFGFAGLRWAETQTARTVENAFLAVILDTPDRPTPQPINGRPGADGGFNVHSPFKQTPGARLARAGLSVIYGIDVDTTGPVEGTIISHGDAGIVINIEQIGSGSGVILHSTQGFEVLVGDTWYSSPIVDHTTSSVTVGHVPCQSGKCPTKIRYLWYSNPCGEGQYGCAVYAAVKPIGSLSGEHDILPLGPFIADLK